MDDDYKSGLNRVYGTGLVYKTQRTSGPDHSPVYTCKLKLHDRVYTGRSSSKKDAEQAAAKRAVQASTKKIEVAAERDVERRFSPSTHPIAVLVDFGSIRHDKAWKLRRGVAVTAFLKSTCVRKAAKRNRALENHYSEAVYYDAAEGCESSLTFCAGTLCQSVDASTTFYIVADRDWTNRVAARIRDCNFEVFCATEMPAEVLEN